MPHVINGYHAYRYGEHQCSYIFQPKKIDLGRLATGFGLLHLPSMPEIRGRKLVGFTPDPIGYDAIPYANKVKEKHRQEALAKSKIKPSDEGEEEGGDLVDGASGGKGSNSKRRQRAKLTEAWSKKKEQREKRDKKKTRKALSKAAATAAAAAAAVAEANADADDWDEDDLEAEARAFKKFKRGKMSKEEYLKFNLDIDDGL